jgi:protein translocase SecG subunit
MEILSIAQIIVSVLLIAVILMQQRGSGGSAIFGGSGGGGAYFQKRGAEKFIFWATIVFAILFFSLALLSLII